MDVRGGALLLGSLGMGGAGREQREEQTERRGATRAATSLPPVRIMPASAVAARPSSSRIRKIAAKKCDPPHTIPPPSRLCCLKCTMRDF